MGEAKGEGGGSVNSIGAKAGSPPKARAVILEHHTFITGESVRGGGGGTPARRKKIIVFMGRRDNSFFRGKKLRWSVAG